MMMARTDHRHASPALTLLLLLLAAADTPVATAQQASVRIAPNQTLADAGYDVSQVLSPSFAGMGIEPSNLFSFTGGDEANAMSINLFANLASFTGVPPHLRIGGNTQDYLYYQADFTDLFLKPNPDPHGQGAYASDSFIIGPGYFDAINRFPAGTPITFGLNLAYDDSDWADRIVELADAARTMLQNVQLTSFEIGNEPDLYLQNGFRSGAWDGSVYTQQWTSRADAIYQRVLQPNNMPSNFFEPGCTASTIGNSFEIEQLGRFGIMSGAPNGTARSGTYVAAFNQHDYYYYIGVSNGSLTMDSFQDLSTTREQFAAWVPQTQQAFDLLTPYVLREMASVGPVGMQGISDTYGAALWTLDFFLYTATLNISSVQIHMTDNSFAAPWQPIFNYDVDPHVRPSYYAFAAIGQIIGASCSTRVQEMPLGGLPSDYDNRVTAYSVYRGTDIAAVVVINTRIANADVNPKGSLAVDLSLPGHANADIFVSSLLGPGTDATADTTWNGMSFETDDWKPATVQDDSAPRQQTLDGSGAATVYVRDASAVVITLNGALGSGEASIYDAQACQALANSRPEPQSNVNPTPPNPSPPDPSPSSSTAPDAASPSASEAPPRTDGSAGPDTTRSPDAPEARASGLWIPSLLAVGFAAAVGAWMV